MPKVSKIDVIIKGQPRTFEVWFNTKDDFTIKNFPEEISRVTKINVQNQTSLGKLEEAAKEAIYKYHELTKTTRKIIAYRMMMSAPMHMNKVESSMHGSSYMGEQSWVPSNARGKIMSTPFGCLQHTIGLEYKLYIEVSLDKIKYFPTDYTGAMGYEKSGDSLTGWCIIDWTEEREKGLEDIAKAMHMMAQKMGTILLDTEKTINMLESGIKLLN